MREVKIKLLDLQKEAIVLALSEPKDPWFFHLLRNLPFGHNDILVISGFSTDYDAGASLRDAREVDRCLDSLAHLGGGSKLVK